MCSINPGHDSREVYSPKEVLRSFVVTSGNGAVLLEFCEEVFDKVAGFIERFIIGSWGFAIGFGRNHRVNIFCLELIENAFIRIIGLVRQKRFCFDTLQ